MKSYVNHIAAGLVGLGLASASAASELYVVHGINGDDLGLGQSLPVDVSVNGGCLLSNVQFGDIEGPVPVDPGVYDVEVRLSTGACDGPLAITRTIEVQFGESSSAVAHLTEQGTPTLTRFVNDLRPTSERPKGRVVVRHAAVAPPVDVNVWRGNRAYRLTDIRNGEQRAAETWSGHVNVVVKPFETPKIGPVPVELEKRTTTVIYAVGSLDNGTFQPLVQVLPLP